MIPHISQVSKIKTSYIGLFRSLSDVGERVKNEVQILQSLRDVKSIVTLRDVLETELHYYLVMDYLGGGDVFDRIVRKGMYQEEEAKKLAYNLLSSVDFMHHRNVAHRDLKPQNMRKYSLDHHLLTVLKLD